MLVSLPPDVASSDCMEVQMPSNGRATYERLADLHTAAAFHLARHVLQDILIIQQVVLHTMACACMAACLCCLSLPEFGLKLPQVGPAVSFELDGTFVALFKFSGIQPRRLCHRFPL